jgi:hypothetical protein
MEELAAVNEPEIPAAVKDLIKVAFVPRDPEIPAAVKVLIKVAFVPRDPEIPAAVKDLIKGAFVPRDPEMLEACCLIKFLLKFLRLLSCKLSSCLICCC